MHLTKLRQALNILWGRKATLRTNHGVRSIRFLLFEIKRVLVLYSIIIYFEDLFILYIFIQNVYANKKVFYKKG